MIQFKNVTFSYPSTMQPALIDVNLQLPAGKVTLIAGASGCGKSTLLRCINGLVPHFSGGSLQGTIRVGGLDPIQLAPQNMSRHVGFIFQDPEAQFIVDRVEDEIAFALENAAIPPQVMHERVAAILELLNLTGLRQRNLDTLSGGERQRVAIAAALVFQPEVLLLDEPTSQLDPASAEDVLKAIHRLNIQYGLTIVLAEHRLERVLPFADWMVHLSSGLPGGLEGTPAQILEQIDLQPPVVRLAKALDWRPLPLTVDEARKFTDNNLYFESPPPRPPGMKQPSETSLTFSASHLPQPFIQVKHLDVHYGKQRAVHGVDFELFPGEILALMGPNGAGKTTLLRAICGLIAPSHGSINVAGKDISGWEVADICKSVGYLPQDPNTLLFADRVDEELMITLQNHKGKMDQAARDIAEHEVTRLLLRLGLSEVSGVYPRDLSVGQRQRVALGAIAITHPGALLLDEPTRGLDYTAKQTLVEILHTWRDESMAILVVTHDVELAAQLADRVAILQDGQIVSIGEPAQVMRLYSTFTPQIAQLFPQSPWLTPDDVLKASSL